MRTMKEPNAKAMLFSLEEAETLRKASAILHEVQIAFGNDNMITSLETGECVISGGIADARGVLEFFATYRVVEIS